MIRPALAYCLKWTRLLRSRGKDVRKFPSALATFAVRAVKNGRTICGMQKSKDVLNPYAQARFAFSCGRLPDIDTLGWTPMQEALADNTRSPVADQVVFRLNFPT